VVVALVVVGVFMFTGKKSGNKPTDLEAAFMKAMNDHSLSGLQKVACDPSVMDGSDASALNAISNAHSTKSPVVTGDSATSSAELTVSAGGSTATMSFTLTYAKNSGKWCVSKVDMPDVSITGADTPTPTETIDTPPPTTPTPMPTDTVNSGGQTGGSACQLPSGATSQPDLMASAPMEVQGVVSVLGSQPKYAWTMTESDGSVLYGVCVDNVSQAGVDNAVTLIKQVWGSTFTFTDDTHRQGYATSLSPSTPDAADVAITVASPLTLDSGSNGSGQGPVEIDWGQKLVS